MAGSHTLEFTDQNFEQDVLKSDQPVLVDFWAAWCAPCRMMAPTVDSLAEEYAGRAKVGKVNVDENLSVTSRYGIAAFPRSSFSRPGRFRSRWSGPRRRLISKLLDKHL